MVFYLTLLAVYLILVGLWLWAVAKWTGLRFPIPDILITDALCSVPALIGTVANRPVQGWLLGLIILALIVTRVEDADLWPEMAFMAGGTVLIWSVAYGAALVLLG
jgi:hypothetical protein